MEDSVMQQHLHHYKEATESAREELAALQAKYQSVHSQVWFVKDLYLKYQVCFKHILNANFML